MVDTSPRPAAGESSENFVIRQYLEFAQDVFALRNVQDEAEARKIARSMVRAAMYVAQETASSYHAYRKFLAFEITNPVMAETERVEDWPKRPEDLPEHILRRTRATRT